MFEWLMEGLAPIVFIAMGIVWMAMMLKSTFERALEFKDDLFRWIRKIKG